MKTATLPLLALLCIGNALAAEATPDLPPAPMVNRLLQEHPLVQAARSTIRAEEANRQRLEAGPHEWNVRVGGQQRRVSPTAAPGDRFSEWSTALERPVRLPGKAALDGELGASGVSLAESGLGDALHEASRDLLKSWFLWLRESAIVRQWSEQSTLLEQQSNAIRRRQQLGDAARLDAVLAEAALAQANAQLTQAQARQRNAEEDLRRRYPGLTLAEPHEIGPPPTVDRTAADWIATLVEHNHELALARGESRRSQIAAHRSRQERLPDPSLGIQFSRERGGEENVLGAYVSIPLPGSARHASAEAASAQADSSSHREAAISRKVSAEAAALFHAAQAARSSWQAAHQAADQLHKAAEMTARAYQLGEGSLNELLAARRLANEARLTERMSLIEARELRYRLLLDAHQLWNFE